MIIEITSKEMMIKFGNQLAKQLKGGDIVELVGDIGSGKTTLTRGIVSGLGSRAEVQSPTFTLSRLYRFDNDLTLTHYDFYRLKDAGIMKHEIHEALSANNAIVIVEWGDVIKNILPKNRLTIQITPTTEHRRTVMISGYGEIKKRLKALHDFTA